MLAFSHLRTIVALPTWLDKLMGSRYPPFDIRNLSKILVKNKLGFKRNENMADQKIRMVGPWTRFRPIVGIYLAVTAYWALVRMRAQVGDWC
jgi:aldehyde dehydrogenase (NAD+)